MTINLSIDPPHPPSLIPAHCLFYVSYAVRTVVVIRHIAQYHSLQLHRWCFSVIQLFKLKLSWRPAVSHTHTTHRKKTYLFGQLETLNWPRVTESAQASSSLCAVLQWTSDNLRTAGKGYKKGLMVESTRQFICHIDTFWEHKIRCMSGVKHSRLIVSHFYTNPPCLGNMCLHWSILINVRRRWSRKQVPELLLARDSLHPFLA